MTHQSDWRDEAHRYLDGDGPPPTEVRQREAVERFETAVRSFAESVPSLDAELDARVMAAVRFRVRRRRDWRWFLTPGAMSMRPALAAAAAVALIALSSAVTMVLDRGASPNTGGAIAVPAVSGGATVLVRFELVAPGAHHVTLAGSFNEWDASSIAFTPTAQAGLWSVTVPLAPGRYQYLFVVDGERWIPDPEAHAQVEDEFGQKNSLLVVGPRGVVRS